MISFSLEKVTDVDYGSSEPIPEVEPDQNSINSAPIIENDGVELNVRGAEVKFVKVVFLTKGYNITTTADRGTTTGTHIIGSSMIRACTVILRQSSITPTRISTTAATLPTASDDCMFEDASELTVPY